MRRFCVIFSTVAVILVGILLIATICRAEDGKKLEKPVIVDGVLFNPDGSILWFDTYINFVRPEIQFWLDGTALRHVKRIQLEANFLLVGAGKDSKEVKTRVKNNETTEDFFRKAFCTEVETSRGCQKLCIGNPDDYIIIVVRMIPDSPMRNCKFLFSFIEKRTAFELGCRDPDVVDYVENRAR